MEQLKSLNSPSTIDGIDSLDGDKVQYIVIRLGEEQYGIDIRYIDNIVRAQRMTRIPKVPAYLKGVINLRGEVLPVMSIRLRMGLPEDETTKATRIIILKLEQEGDVGIIVDEVKEVVTLSGNQIEKIINTKGNEKNSFINAVGKHNDNLISLLDLSTITLEENM